MTKSGTGSLPFPTVVRKKALMAVRLGVIAILLTGIAATILQKPKGPPPSQAPLCLHGPAGGSR